MTNMRLKLTNYDINKTFLDLIAKTERHSHKRSETLPRMSHECCETLARISHECRASIVNILDICHDHNFQ